MINDRKSAMPKFNHAQPPGDTTDLASYAPPQFQPSRRPLDGPLGYLYKAEEPSRPPQANENPPTPESAPKELQAKASLHPPQLSATDIDMLICQLRALNQPFKKVTVPAGEARCIDLPPPDGRVLVSALAHDQENKRQIFYGYLPQIPTPQDIETLSDQLKTFKRRLPAGTSIAFSVIVPDEYGKNKPLPQASMVPLKNIVTDPQIRDYKTCLATEALKIKVNASTAAPVEVFSAEDAIQSVNIPTATKVNRTALKNNAPWLANELFKRAGLNKEMSVLEIGSGSGEITRELRESHGINVHSIEPDFDALSYGLKNGNLTHNHAFLGTMQEYAQHWHKLPPEKQKYYDHVFATRTCMPGGEIQAVVEAVYPLLKNKGKITLHYNSDYEMSFDLPYLDAAAKRTGMHYLTGKSHRKLITLGKNHDTWVHLFK